MEQHGYDAEVEEFTVELGVPAHGRPDPHEPEVVLLARGFLVTGRESVRFLWRRRSDWFAVTLRRESGVGGRARAHVTAAPAVLPRGLTHREIEVLTLVALGLTNAEVSARLGTQPRTVSTQVAHLLGKLGQTSRAGLAAVAVDASLVVLPLPGGPVDSIAISQAEVDHAATTLQSCQPQRPTPSVGFERRRPVLLGTLAPLLGAAADDGAELVRGASLAVRDINGRGGVLGRPLEQVVEPVDLFDRSSVADAVRRLCRAGVDAVHTNYVTAEVPGVLEELADHGRPFLHTATLESHVELVRSRPERFGMVFQTCPSEEYYRLGFVGFLQEAVGSGAWDPADRRVVALEADSETSVLADHRLDDLLAEAGWSLRATVRAPLRSPDWRRLAARIAELRPDVLLVSHFLPEVALLQVELSAQGFPGLVYYVYAASIPRFQALAGAAAEGVVWSSVTARYDDAMGQRFHREFTLRFGEPPGWSQASAAYDQVALLGGAWTAQRSVDPAAACEGLRSSIVRGLNGMYFLGQPEQAALCYPHQTQDASLGQALLVYQVRDGRSVALSPAPKGDLRRFRPPRAAPAPR